MQNEIVLVTGANGFIGAHVIQQLIKQKFHVLGTVRSQDKKQQTLKTFQELLGKETCKEFLEIELADLGDKKDWEVIIQRCTYLIHVATPIYFKLPNQEEKTSILKQAVDGTQYILELCAKHKVKKIIMTSSVAAISGMMDSDKEQFSKDDWTSDDIDVVYPLQKTLQEKVAWKVAQELGLNLTTICPVTVLGKQLMNNRTATATGLKFLFKSPIYMELNLAIVDVVDVAKAHVECLKKQELTKGKRYITSEGTYTTTDILNILKQDFSQYGYWLAQYKFPSFIFSILGVVIKRLKMVQKVLKKRVIYDCVETNQDLNMQYRSLRQTVNDTVHDLVQKKVIENRIQQK